MAKYFICHVPHHAQLIPFLFCPEWMFVKKVPKYIQAVNAKALVPIHPRRVTKDENDGSRGRYRDVRNVGCGKGNPIRLRICSARNGCFAGKTVVRPNRLAVTNMSMTVATHTDTRRSLITGGSSRRLCFAHGFRRSQANIRGST